MEANLTSTEAHGTRENHPPHSHDRTEVNGNIFRWRSCERNCATVCCRVMTQLEMSKSEGNRMARAKRTDVAWLVTFLHSDVARFSKVSG